MRTSGAHAVRVARGIVAEPPSGAERTAKVMERIARREPQKKQQHFLKVLLFFFVREAARPNY
jgi:hypothetical protein